MRCIQTRKKILKGQSKAQVKRCGQELHIGWDGTGGMDTGTITVAGIAQGVSKLRRLWWDEDKGE